MRDGARLSAIRRVPQRLDHPDPKAEGRDRNAPVTQARDEIHAQERELGRPHVGGRPYDEHPSLELDRAGPIGDAGSDRLSPYAIRDGCLSPSEPSFARALKGHLERFRLDESGPSRAGPHALALSSSVRPG